MDEFALIERLAEVGWKGSRGVVLGPGDDAAVMRGGMVVSTDLAVEGVHFQLDWITPMEAGFRAGAAALSDIAAMGADPLGLLVSLAVPSADEATIAFQRGVAAAADRVAVPIVGGDVSRSPGPVVIDIVALGRSKSPVLRAGALDGDDLWLSGSVGAAAFAVREWVAGREPSEGARDRFVRPPDRTGLGRRLAAEGIARAMIDVSDGLAADLGHIARASGVRGVIRLGAVPIHPEVSVGAHDASASKPSPGTPLRTPPGTAQGLNPALVGGEDYELLFSAPPGLDQALAIISADMAVPLTRIGFCERGEGVEAFRPDGSTLNVEGRGFDHFSEVEKPS